MLNKYKKLISLEEISLLTGYSLSYLFALVKKSSISYKRQKGKIYVTEEWLEEFLTNYTFEAFLKKQSSLPRTHLNTKVREKESTLHKNVADIKEALKNIGPYDSYLDEDLVDNWQEEFLVHHQKIKHHFIQKRKEEEHKKKLSLYARMSYEPVPLKRHHKSIILYKKPALPTKINKITALVLVVIILMMILGGSYQFVYKDIFSSTIETHKKSRYPKPNEEILSKYIRLHKDKIKNKQMFISVDELFGGEVAGIYEINKEIGQKNFNFISKTISQKISYYLKKIFNKNNNEGQ